MMVALSVGICNANGIARKCEKYRERSFQHTRARNAHTDGVKLFRRYFAIFSSFLFFFFFFCESKCTVHKRSSRVRGDESGNEIAGMQKSRIHCEWVGKLSTVDKRRSARENRERQVGAGRHEALDAHSRGSREMEGERDAGMRICRVDIGGLSASAARTCLRLTRRTYLTRSI